MDWKIALTAFGLVFVAELGDKTQLAVLAQTCKFRRPGAVFLGASLALVAVTALGAAGGQLVGRLIPPEWVRVAAAIAFALMGAVMAREAIRDGAKNHTGDCPEAEGGSSGGLGWKAFAATFGLIFLAEMGDKTQLAVLSLAGKRADAVPVFIGGALALTAVTAVGVVGGQGLLRLIPRRALLGISALAFGVMGALIGLGIL